MAYRIVTDTGCDYPQQMYGEMNLTDRVWIDNRCRNNTNNGGTNKERT